ncbi:MAG TPA: UDP-N-acetylmuramate dehydrogenase [Vicinamibacteria bacterium]|nr:UDP-N-acetylmuramate dehydrogenase [Vicinamibacteria bacterium]
MDLAAALRARLGPARARENVPLAPLTTLRVGGPADVLAEVQSADEALSALRLAREAGVAVYWLGGGSNLLVGDLGVRGLVVRWHGGAISSPAPDRVRAEAGVTVNGLVRYTIGHGLAGLAAWAGTPGTVGGAVHGNAHFQGRMISEYVVSVRVATPDGAVCEVPASEMEFGYDRSRLQQSREVALTADFRVGPGEPGTLREEARRSLAFRKRTQPLALPSAGCVFQNPDPSRVALPSGRPASAGALVDAAGLKGRACGGARVSSVHANFVVNEGGASARDVASLIESMREAVAARFGVVLEEEIVRVGEFA